MWINEEVNRRLRGYLITQMSNFLQFLLAVNEIKDSDTTTFDEVCVSERSKYIYRPTHDRPYFKCLWDIIYNYVGFYIIWSYTPIFSAYCRSNDINTKTDLYIKMVSNLESWVDTIDQFEEMMTISIGMSKNTDIYSTFMTYFRYRKSKPMTFYIDTLDILIKNNFENIDPYSYIIQPYIQSKQIYNDPLQQLFYKLIMHQINLDNKTNNLLNSSTFLCAYISRQIYNKFNITMPIYTEMDIGFEKKSQIIDYCESKIPQYPTSITNYLLILQSINGYIPGDEPEIPKLAKMAELSHYNLRNLPILAIIFGNCGATSLYKIPLEDIPEYYARLTYSYLGRHTKAACR